MTTSVIIPTYNQDAYLKQAIESVLNQTYPADEVIVVDDGSTDNTPSIVNSYGNAVQTIRHDNQGLAATRNAGICLARGDYVCFLDSDDRWAPTFLEHMNAFATQQPGGTAYYCAAFYMDERSCLLPQIATSMVVPTEEVYQALLRANFLNANAILLERSTILQADLFDVEFRRLQDWEFWLRLARSGARFHGTNTPLVYYRLHRDALSTDTIRGEQAAMALAAKHVGPDDGHPTTWLADKKRLYGGVYRYRALLALQRRQDWVECAQHLVAALRCDPTLAADGSLFYELALGAQPLGYRGTSQFLDVRDNETHIRVLLATIFESEDAQSLGPLSDTVRASSYVALARVAYSLSELELSKEWLRTALRYRPALWQDRRVIAMLGKTMLGPERSGRVRRWFKVSG